MAANQAQLLVAAAVITVNMIHIMTMKSLAGELNLCDVVIDIATHLHIHFSLLLIVR
jgi:hypothetical protein